jgi:transcriptional regulator with XRE-family HTH domain
VEDLNRPRVRSALRLGRSLRDLRDERGWSRKDLAARTGLSYPYISQLENGDREPSFDTLTRLAEAFGLAVEELIAPATAHRPPTPRPATAGGRQWIPGPAYQGPPASSEVPPEPAATDRGTVVDRAYQLLQALPPQERLDAAGALLARCLADHQRRT